MKYKNSALAVVILVSIFVSLASAQNNPRHIANDSRFDKVETLGQNWTHDLSNWFYSAPQGSRLLPYDWYLNLEQAGSEAKFNSPENIQRLGYIPRTSAQGNQDALPIGFVKDLKFDDGKDSLGITCAACHTGQIIHDKVSYIIDGGPTLGDFEGLLKDLVASMEATTTDTDKFKRFSKSVLGASPTTEQLDDLIAEMKMFTVERRRYNERNLPGVGSHHPFGFGRVDAFGAIFNEVSTKFLGLPDNGGPANAPVSYPCLWDTPQHERVQWNGAAKNRISPLGRALFGTPEVGALGRNAGEVLGVFGHVVVNDQDRPIDYKSTINKANLISLENSLKTLWSPEWPEAFGALDEVKKAKGRELFKSHCMDCHQDIKRSASDRKVAVKISNEDTDLQMLLNFKRVAKTGKLEHRLISITGNERFKEEAFVGQILKHMVQRSIIQLDLNSIRAQLKNLKHSDLDLLNPGYSNMAVIDVGGAKIPIPFADLKSLDKMIQQTDDTEQQFRQALEKLRSKIVDEPEGQLPIGYKSRPLNGIWATAPYLHNGSVPNLTELLKKPEDRNKKFHVGSQVYDPVNVGFENDSNYPEFKTQEEDGSPIIGNSNLGHDHGWDLSSDDKAALIEYLKSL